MTAIGSNTKILEMAQEVLSAQTESLIASAKRINKSFADAVSIICKCEGRVIVSGMGKSGLVGRKLVATLSSTGTPSSFVHPAEAFHGDLGMIKADDTVILISYSGRTEEVIKMIPFLRTQGNKIIAFTAGSDSPLHDASAVAIDIKVERESCFHNLAPSSSTTVTIALGDALALTASQVRGFKPEDFAKFHPGGTLGRKLLATVDDFMRSSQVQVQKDATFIETLHNVSEGMTGLAVVVDDDGKLAGIVTSGDLRRAVERHQKKCFELTAEDFMNKQPVTLPIGSKIGLAEELLASASIPSLVIVDEGSVKGILLAFDLM